MPANATQREGIGFEQRDGLLDDARRVDQLRLCVPDVSVPDNSARPSERLLDCVEPDRAAGRAGHIDETLDPVRPDRAPGRCPFFLTVMNPPADVLADMNIFISITNIFLVKRKRKIIIVSI
jgi:hypothetical protein